MSWASVEKDVGRGPMGLFKWVLIGFLALSTIGGLAYCHRQVSKPLSMAVYRAVMKQSFQYKEGMAQRVAILEASIIELDIALQGNPENRKDLINQKRILSAQLKAISINN
jgi:hypothetical protein